MTETRTQPQATRPILVMAVGRAGSGKSMLLRHDAALRTDTVTFISSDEIRQQLSGTTDLIPERETEVWHQFHEQLKQAFTQKHRIYLDATFLTPHSRKVVFDLLRAEGAHYHILLYEFTADLPTAMANQETRERKLSLEAMQAMENAYVPLDAAELQGLFVRRIPIPPGLPLLPKQQNEVIPSNLPLDLLEKTLNLLGFWQEDQHWRTSKAIAEIKIEPQETPPPQEVQKLLEDLIAKGFASYLNK